MVCDGVVKSGEHRHIKCRFVEVLAQGSLQPWVSSVSANWKVKEKRTRVAVKSKLRWHYCQSRSGPNG